MLPLPSLTSSVITLGLYVIPKMAQSFNSNILPPSIQPFYQRCSDFFHSHHRIEVLSTAIGDNFWIVFFVLQYLAQISGTNLFSADLIEKIIPGLLAGTGLLHAGRTMLSRRFPSIAQYIGPSCYY